MAINQGLKQAIPAKFILIVSVVLGLAAGLFVLPYEGGIQAGVINGLAMGLFDLGKKAASIVSGDKTE